MNITKHIPNTITSMNLLCGAMGVIFTFQGRFDLAFYMMASAAVCDFFDGFSARLLNAYSPLGKELDSLADLISFGLLPSIMLHRLLIINGITGFLSYIPLTIAVLSAIRLAKFNIDERQTDNFIGLPTPACAILCGAFTYYVFNDPSSMLNQWACSRFFIPAVSIVLSLLLVSEIPMFSMKFKKNMKSESLIHKQRIAFAGIILAAAVLTVLSGLNWSMILILAFASYIIMNVAVKLVSGK